MAAEKDNEKDYNRRDFLKNIGIGSVSLGFLPLLQNGVTAAEPENKATRMGLCITRANTTCSFNTIRLVSTGAT